MRKGICPVLQNEGDMTGELHRQRGPVRRPSWAGDLVIDLESKRAQGQGCVPALPPLCGLHVAPVWLLRDRSWVGLEG